MNQRRRRMVGGLMIAVLLLSACRGETLDGQKKRITKPSERPNVTEKTEIYPLTGLPADEAGLHRRAVGVMVNNHSQARPQSGLYKADIVYEALTEGRITRFLAIFQSQTPDVIGPVRSARPYFIELNNGYGAIYVAHGWSPDAKKMLESGGTDYIQGLYHDGTWFKRVAFRKAPHNSYIPYKNIIKGAEESGFSLTQTFAALPFYKSDEEKNIPGEPAQKMTITYSNDYVVGYNYNSEDGLYYREVNGEPMRDRETNTPVTAANVFVVSADHRFIDAYRRTIDLRSGGPAYLFQKGKWRAVTWKNVDGRLLPYDGDRPLKWVPGRIWIHIVESDPGLDHVVKIDGQKG